MKWRQLFFASLLLAVSARADSVSTNEAVTILERVWTNRAAKDFSLQARLFVTRDDAVPVEILVKNLTAETRTVFRTGKTELLVVQPVREAPRFYRRGSGEITGTNRLERLAGSSFTFYDLGLSFLRWPVVKLVGQDKTRGRACDVIEATATGEPFAHVKMWIDREYAALLRMEARDENDNLVRRFAVTSFKKIGEVWVPRGLEIAFVPPGQTLPAQEKSRLEVYEGNYDAQLPAEWFDPAKF